MEVNWLHVLRIVIGNLIGMAIGCGLWFGIKYIIKEFRIFLREERNECNKKY